MTTTARKKKNTTATAAATVKLGEFVAWEGKSFQVALMKVTPKLAGTWFNNTREMVNEGKVPQRTISRRVTEFLTNVMKEDSFLTTHQGICLFEVNGKICVIDGQHRCASIMEIGKPQLMFVFRGFPPDIFKGIDINYGRKAQDAFMCLPGRAQISRPAATRITNIARIVMSKREMDTRNPSDIAAFANVHRHFMAITTIDQKLKMGNKQLRPHSVAAFVHASLWAEERDCDDKVMAMVERFSKQKWSDEKDVMLALREKMIQLIQAKLEPNCKTPTANDYYLVTIEAINAGIKGKKLTKFTMKVEGLS